MSRPRRWLVLTAESPSAELIPALAEGLVDLGGSAVQEEGLTLRTFLPEADTEEGDRAGQRAADDAERVLAARTGGAPVRVRWHWQDDEDWLARWRTGLAPRRVGDRFVVAPTWTLSQLPAAPDQLVIAIDPQMAFGTGEHASTRGVLRLLERAVRPGDAVLDVGTGSGILAIAAGLLCAASVDAVESDPDAICNARDNLRRNGAAAVALTCALVDDAYLRARLERYDLIVANVLRGVLEPLLPSFHGALRPGGALIVGGILDAEAHVLLAAASTAGFTLRREDREEGWWSAILERHRGVQPSSLSTFRTC